MNYEGFSYKNENTCFSIDLIGHRVQSNQKRFLKGELK